MADKANSVLIIYTGGTIGMVEDYATGTLSPFNFHQIMEEVPELKKFGFELSTIAFDPPIDSSNVTPDLWIKLAHIIEQNYENHTGFVVMHGTDTMSYSASALSYMLENLYKPVIFTGSQLPIGTLRTDGKENLISAIEIAAATQNGEALVPEVCVFFQNKLYRGNRTVKNNSENFNAFISPNYPTLANAGVRIKYNYEAIHYPAQKRKLKVYNGFDDNIAILKLFPGIRQHVVDAMINIKGLKALIIETYGSGNAPDEPWMISSIKKGIEKGLLIVNVTQCISGSVEMGKYETSVKLLDAGVISGYDITTEAAVTKIMFLLGQKELSKNEIIFNLNKSICGEISIA
jgi:L-asparaginase